MYTPYLQNTVCQDLVLQSIVLSLSRADILHERQGNGIKFVLLLFQSIHDSSAGSHSGSFEIQTSWEQISVHIPATCRHCCFCSWFSHFRFFKVVKAGQIRIIIVEITFRFS